VAAMVDAVCDNGSGCGFGAASKGHYRFSKKPEKMNDSITEHFLATL
jgi:hypothetical protein